MTAAALPEIPIERGSATVTDALRTEYAFVLPRGYVDGTGTVHREGVMRLATARDEIIPQRDPRVRENEAYLTIDEFGPTFDIVYPSSSILAEPSVALIDKVVDRKGTRELAEAYLRFLYTPAAQDLIGKHHFRPREAAAVAKYADHFKPLPLVTIDDAFGGWKAAQATHFAEGGVFDQIHKDA